MKSRRQLTDNCKVGLKQAAGPDQLFVPSDPILWTRSIRIPCARFRPSNDLDSPGPLCTITPVTRPLIFIKRAHSNQGMVESEFCPLPTAMTNFQPSPAPTYSKERVDEAESGSTINAEEVVMSPKEERRLLRKFDFYILPPLTFMYSISYHLSPSQHSIFLGICAMRWIKVMWEMQRRTVGIKISILPEISTIFWL